MVRPLNFNQQIKEKFLCLMKTNFKEKTYVLHPKNVPTKPPILTTAVLFLYLVQLNATFWVYIAAVFFCSCIWACCFFVMSHEFYVDIEEDLELLKEEQELDGMGEENEN